MVISIVVTSVNHDALVKFTGALYNNLCLYGHNLSDIKFIIVGDNKSEAKTRDYYAGTVGPGMYEFWSSELQREWLKDKFEGIDYSKIVPENSPRRRNFGYLRALQLGSDYTIVMDDDNLPVDEVDWLKGHLEVLSGDVKPVVAFSCNDILNPCRLLTCHKTYVYSRGYPVGEMLHDNFDVLGNDNSNREVWLNQGLWVNKPDVDSICNMVYPDLNSENSSLPVSHVIPFDNQYFPVNSQNTAFNREVAKIFWNVHMGMVGDLSLDRFDDVWNGLFIQRVLNYMCKGSCFGKPVVAHVRNTHDYVKDLNMEYLGLIVNNAMWNWVMSVPLESNDIMKNYAAIAISLSSERKLQYEVVNDYINNLGKEMVIWLEMVSRLLK